MRKTILLAGGVICISLMSFTSSKNNGIIEINGNTITVKNTSQLSKKDLNFLSQNIQGWTYCKQISENSNCNTMNRSFPSGAEARSNVEKVLAKYQ